MDSIFQCARLFLSALDPETAHLFTLRALRVLGQVRRANRPPGDTIEVAGLNFPNRVGLAAGFDKNGEAITGLNQLGFGFVEIGAVTPMPQSGNPKPRLFRLTNHRAVINRMGFNNEGVEALRERLRVTPEIKPTLLGVNLGINRDTPISKAKDDYLQCMRLLSDLVDYFTINISSPNTPKLRDLHGGARLSEMLKTLLEERDQLIVDQDRRLPLFVKVSPDLEPALVRELALCIREARCDGLVATNTTTARDGIRHRLSAQKGGLSGQPLFNKSIRTVEAVRDAVGADFPIIGVGGISNGSDAIAMRNAGADLIQVYTALVYEGPRLVDALVTALADS